MNLKNFHFYYLLSFLVLIKLLKFYVSDTRTFLVLYNEKMVLSKSLNINVTYRVALYYEPVIYTESFTTKS